MSDKNKNTLFLISDTKQKCLFSYIKKVPFKATNRRGGILKKN